MARYTVYFSVALSATTEKTVARIVSPSSRKLTLRRMSITDKLAGSGDQGIRWKLVTGGTGGTGTDQTPYPLNSAAACSSTAKVNFSGEPSGGTAVLQGAIPAGGGCAEPWEGEEGITVPHSSAISLALYANEARGSGIVEGFLEFEE